MSALPLLPGPFRELLKDGKIKGGMMAAHVEFATKGRTPAELLRFWAMLPSELQESLQTMILPVKWYEFSDLMTVDRAIVKVYGNGDPVVLRRVGSLSARHNFNGPYKAYRRDDIHEFLANGARFHPKFQDFGDAVYVKTSPSSGQMVHSGYSSYSPLFCESALGFYHEALEIHHARTIEVHETSCQCRGMGSCTFVLRWR